MNSLLKSPIKNNLTQIPMNNGQSSSGKMGNFRATQMVTGSNISIKGDRTNAMMVAPSAFV